MKKIIIIISLLGFFQCATGFEKRRRAYSTKQTAYYYLAKNDLSENELLKSPISHPFKLEALKIKDILGNLKYNNRSAMIEFTDFIFNSTELDEISNDLTQILENVGKGDIIIGISIYDDIKSVISNHKRTTFMFWIDGKGLNIVFGEIKKDIPKEMTRYQFEWTSIEAIPLSIKESENKILLDGSSEFNKVNGFLNNKWLIFQLKELEKYKYKDRIESRI